MDNTVIRVQGVSKKFCKRLRHSMYYGTLDVARGMLGIEARTGVLRPGEFWAVDDMSFDIERGKTLGLIGLNGSGKSTLLRLLNGVYQPDRGRIEIRGRVGALIAVGAGFHPLMTGRENIYLNGAILGMKRHEIDRKFDSIVDFADIGDFLDSPVKTYSSGMYVRLGFAVAIHSEPDILLVDEVLAVGDAKFQQKCYARMKSLQETGTTIILVTHDMNNILRHCKSAILLDKGCLVAQDSAKEVVNRYFSLLWDPPNAALAKNSAETEQTGAVREGTPGPAGVPDRCRLNPGYNPGGARFGNGRARITDFNMLDEEGREITRLKSGEYMRFRVSFFFNDDVELPVYGFSIKTKDGMVVYGTNTLELKLDARPARRGEVNVLEFQTRVPLLPGSYFLSTNVVDASMGMEEVLDRRYDLAHLEVISAGRIWAGAVDLASSVSFVGHAD